MPTGPGGLDANGVWQYGEDDTEALASDLLNLGMASISTEVGLLDAAVAAIVTGQILQVVHAEKLDTFTTTSSSFVDITDLDANITPSGISSKVIVISRISFSNTSSNTALAKILRDATDLTIGTPVSSRPGAAAAGTADATSAGFVYNDATVFHYDSPASTSELTYKAQIRRGAGGTAVVNRSGNDNDNDNNPRTFSSITLMEVAG